MKKSYFGYVRVSTQKQGEQGVSLQEQRNAILGYAQRQSLEISRWFEERETAAKIGRPLFLEMLKLLKKGQATGVVIHKIDRSSRNLRDWLNLQDLSDSGIEVHFVNESLDLQSRGGRLSADIQAVVAADYIRNLREETKKGFYGRLKQGYYPLPAPLGYLDRGKAKAKEIDPIRGPLIRKAFELYATNQYSLVSLVTKLKEIGLSNRRNGPVTKSSLSLILNNPFYIGIMRITTGGTFEGLHAPLISPALFEQVQNVLNGRFVSVKKNHDYVFRKLISCKSCGFKLIGEIQKGHIYYRCHTKKCDTKCVREEEITQNILPLFQSVRFNQDERSFLKEHINSLRKTEVRQRENEISAANLTIKNIESRLLRLTDALVDGLIDKEAYHQRQQAFLQEKKKWEHNLSNLEHGNPLLPDRVNKFLELSESLDFQYKMASVPEKREILKFATSNRTVSGKNIDIMLSLPLSLIVKRSENSNGPPFQNTGRTLMGLVAKLANLFKIGAIKLPEWQDLQSAKDHKKAG